MSDRNATMMPALLALGAAGGVRAQAPAAPLTLGAAVAQALATNPAAQAAAEQIAQAEARLGQAQAGRRLQITFNSSAGGSNANVIQPPPSQESFYTLQNTLTVPLPLGSRANLAIRQAQSLLDASEMQAFGARATLAAQVGAAYFDLLRKQALLLVAQQTLDQAQRALGEARLRNAAGDVPQLDVLRAQVPVASAQAVLLSAGNDVAVARETLSSLIGQPLDAPLAVADVPPAAAALQLTLEQARAQALAFSPDARAARFTVQADEAALEAARHYADPTVSLQAIDIRSDDQTSFSRVDTVQAAVTVPLSDGGLGRAQVREAEAAVAQAQAQEALARRAALLAVTGAYLTAQSLQAQIAAAREARDIAQVAYDKTVEGYRGGLFPLTDVLNAQAALTQSQVSYTRAVYEAAAAANTLDAALSGGLGVGPGAAPAPPVGPGGAPTTGGGTSPAGTGGPTNTPSGDSTTGPNTGGAGAAGRGGP